MWTVVGLWLLYGTGEHSSAWTMRGPVSRSLIRREFVILPLQVESVGCRGRVRTHRWMLRAERGSISRLPHGLPREKVHHLASLI